MPLTVYFDNPSIWSRLEQNVAKMMEFVLDTYDMPTPKPSLDVTDTRLLRGKRAYTRDLITCKVCSDGYLFHMCSLMQNQICQNKSVN